MRFLAGCLFCLTIPALALSSPLTTKDVSLMLRSGYSSESILQEITQRRMADALDAKTRSTLIEFGATPQLIDALASGQYKVSAQEAARAKDAAVAASAAQEKEAEKVFRAATVTLREQHTRAAAQAAEISPLMHSLGAKLVRLRDDAVQPANADEKKKLIAIYYSAQWCPPCRKFTPQLVDFYNRNAAQHPEFELIFYSFDRSRENWESYLRTDKMPWSAIDYDQIASLSGLRKICGDGIPSLVLLDGQGQLLCDSYDAGKYVGPQKVVAELEKRFAAGPGGPVVQTR